MSNGDNNTTTTSSSINDSADFWRYDIGVNVIPADTRTKKPITTWDEWQDKPIPEDKHNEWKEQGLFSKGIAIIPGRVWHRPDRSNLYLVFIDADSQKAIDELCSRPTTGDRTNNDEKKIITLQELAQDFIIEQHNDALDRAHLYFYSSAPFPKKPSDGVIGLEVKSLGEHGIAYCSPSLHKDGQTYEIIGTKSPAIFTDELAKQYLEFIDGICRRHGLEYLEKHHRNLLDSEEKIYQGSRHDSLLSIANSILFRYNGGVGVSGNDDGKFSEQDLKDRFIEVNNKRCDPSPLPAAELDKLWKDAVAYYTETKAREDAEIRKSLHDINNNNMSDGKRDTLCRLLQVYKINSIPSGDIWTMIS